MQRTHSKKVVAMTFAFGLVLSCAGVAAAQWNSPNAYGYSTGYGTVYCRRICDWKRGGS